MTNGPIVRENLTQAHAEHQDITPERKWHGCILTLRGGLLSSVACSMKGVMIGDSKHPAIPCLTQRQQFCSEATHSCSWKTCPTVTDRSSFQTITCRSLEAERYTLKRVIRGTPRILKVSKTVTESLRATPTGPPQERANHPRDPTYIHFLKFEWWHQARWGELWLLVNTIVDHIPIWNYGVEKRWSLGIILGWLWAQRILSPSLLLNYSSSRKLKNPSEVVTPGINGHIYLAFARMHRTQEASHHAYRMLTF